MGNDKPQLVTDNPLDRPLETGVSAIHGLDRDEYGEAEAFWYEKAGLPPTRAGHASSHLERTLEYTDWKADHTREGRFSKGTARLTYQWTDRADGLLWFPLLWLGIGIFEPDEVGMGFAAATWVCTLAFWTPLTLWRVFARNPPGDMRRCAAWLAATWLSLPPLIPAYLAGEIAMLVTFAIVWLVDLYLLYRALRVPPAAKPSP